MVSAKDLAAEPPRSPRFRLGGYAILARALDKCRAELAEKSGEYHYDCELDKRFLAFKKIAGAELKKFVAGGATDDAVVAWVEKNGLPKSEAEISAWSDAMERFNYADDSEGQKWLKEKNKKYGLPPDGTLFGYLEADDRASFAKKS